MRWKELFKFLSGFFAATTIVNLYLYFYGASFIFLGFTISPNILLLRSAVHFILFLIFIYFGFIKKEEHARTKKRLHSR